MNLADPELEFIDPTPNVYSLFITFDDLFFWTKLAGKAVVRWSKRMYSCAGVCSYEGRGGICDIALSEPLLKLRPRKDLVETLLHEMIHAYLFVVGKDQSRDGHGPNFLSHMYRINQAAGLNISVYHEFHDEVELYMNHVWRCNGPCQKMRPFFGIVRRSANRAPGPSDTWWNKHMRICGGTFIKFSEPEKLKKKATTRQPKTTTKPNADITNYLTNNNETIIKNKNNNADKQNPILNKPPAFKGGGQLGGLKHSSSDVAETVRNIWANKTITSKSVTKKVSQTPKSQVKTNNKRPSDLPHSQTPPKKVKTIDDYFKTASSILKDVYGADFTVTQDRDSAKLKAVPAETLLQCPICNNQVSETLINSHIDECLNADVVEKLAKDTISSITPIKQANPKVEAKDIVNITPSDIKPTMYKPEVKERLISSSTPIKTEPNISNWVDLTTIRPNNNNLTRISSIKIEPSTSSCIDLTMIPITAPSTSTQVHRQKCPCCGKNIDKTIQEHLDECLSFFDNETTIPEEGASTSLDRTLVIDDSDDEFDETQTLNKSGTKLPCPCCMKMVEIAEMNDHLDVCLGLKD